MKSLKTVRIWPLLVSNYPRRGYKLLSPDPSSKWQMIVERTSLDHNVSLHVGNQRYELNLRLIIDSKFIIWIGVNNEPWNHPILCYELESFSHEIIVWHARIGFGRKIDATLLGEIIVLGRELGSVVEIGSRREEIKQLQWSHFNI